MGHRDQMAAARGILQKNVPILYTASQACLQHPDVAAYKANRDLIYKQLQQAVTGISNAAQATASDDASQHQGGGGGELAYALNNFDVSYTGRKLQALDHPLKLKDFCGNVIKVSKESSISIRYAI